MRAVAGRGDTGTEPGRGTAAADAAQAPAETIAPRPAPVRPEALHRAAQAGDIEGLTAALEAGVDIDARDGRGWTALMHAVNKGYLLLVEPLLAANADPDVRAPDGATALFMAALHGHSEVVDLLMKTGADLSVRGPQGRTAVDVARARYGDVEAARSNDEVFGVVALVQGMTWAEAQDAQKAVDEMIASLKPKCAGRAKILACWKELADKRGCYVWINRLFDSDYALSRITGFTSRWSGKCFGNMHGSVAVGSGTLTLVWRHDDYEYSRRGTGMLKNGKKQGRWTINWAGGSSTGKWEGGYVDGRRQGNWVDRNTTRNYESVTRGSFMNDRLEGRYVHRSDNGRYSSEGIFRSGKKHGKWHEKSRDKRWVEHWNYGNRIVAKGKKRKKSKTSHESEGGR